MSDTHGSGPRSALVTGGSMGIGLAIARMLVDEGYAVTVVARSPEGVQATADALGGLGVAADVSNADDCRRAIAAHLERHGGLDVLVSAAGICEEEAVDALTPESIDRQIAINVRGTMLLARGAAAPLRASAGLAVLFSSGLVHRPLPDLAVYTATKAAVLSFAQTMGAELGIDGVRVTTISPGLVATRMADGYAVPMERMVQPEDCAEVVRALLRLTPNTHVPEVIVRMLNSANKDPRVSAA